MGKYYIYNGQVYSKDELLHSSFKYIRREGTKGNYKYYYKQNQTKNVKQNKGNSESSKATKTTKTTWHKNGDFVNLKFFLTLNLTDIYDSKKLREKYSDYLDDLLLKEGDGAKGSISLAHKTGNPYELNWEVKNDKVCYTDKSGKETNSVDEFVDFSGSLNWINRKK